MTRPLMIASLPVGCERLMWLRQAQRVLSVRARTTSLDILFTITQEQEIVVRKLPGYVPVEKYASRLAVAENVVGHCEIFSFALLPDLGFE